MMLIPQVRDSGNDFQSEIVETTLFFSRFRFLRVGSRISVLGVIILPGTQILKSDLRYPTEDINPKRYDVGYTNKN